jgi:hypothetical protein
VFLVVALKAVHVRGGDYAARSPFRLIKPFEHPGFALDGLVIEIYMSVGSFVSLASLSDESYLAAGQCSSLRLPWLRPPSIKHNLNLDSTASIDVVLCWGVSWKR